MRQRPDRWSWHGPSAVVLGAMGVAVAPVASAASFCAGDSEIRVEAVEMNGAAVSAIEVRNVGLVAGNVSGLEVVVVGDTRGDLHDYVRSGKATIHRLAFPANLRIDVGEVVTVSLRGSYAYKQQHGGTWPDFELPVRGGEPEVPNMRISGGFARLGAAPERVGLVCVAEGRDLDVMEVQAGVERLQAPPWIPPRLAPDGVESAGADIELMVAPSADVGRDGVVTYVVHVRPRSTSPTPVSLELTLPDGLVFEEWLSSPDDLTPPEDSMAPFWEGVLSDGLPRTWVARVRFDPSSPPLGRLRASARATSGETESSAKMTFVAVPEPDQQSSRPGAPEREVEVDDKGQVGTFTRAFLPDGDPVTQDINVGLDARLQVDVEHGDWHERGKVYGLIDATDPRRDAVFVEDLYIAWRSGDFQIVVGAVTLNTSRLDTFHPADVINARFLDTEIENPAKIGEPMVSGRANIPKGAVTAYVMPWFTAPRLASPRSRFNPNPGLELGQPLYLQWSGSVRQERYGLQWGLNLEQTYGPVDLSVQFLRHQDRQQPIVVEVPGEPLPQLLSLPVNHVGFNYNQAVGSTVLKGEAAWRRFGRSDAAPAYLDGLAARDHVALAGGLEYSFGVGPYTLAALAEGQWIVLEGQDDPVVRASLSPFQRDALVGARLTFNDRANRSLVLLAIVDLETADEVFGGLRYGQRMGEHWTLAASVRSVFAPEPGPAGPQTGLQALRDLRFANLLVSRHF